ncbi:M48 family metallopeptidase [Candidatus Bathyarchaeota archaeon]|jgi:heat shock protein HtpX|nr:M48 family metallopeptidase [Candidatus Bathyarchaeota archaeon]MBT4320375.1 M48 family metallopeptidase [Candidatus Bathyarchaeota archaeon]MBT4424386.1 M48 family metallopeptidase [Candidatus Bathyarchaeota archaeon]MBT5642204.1 M48 family metallopeptidase [Candidatus Bathyarchaeota archaeon]MBT6605563.1 M48 family metallopeptidase [Candidatus Bathyarchaeota archaeon]
MERRSFHDEQSRNKRDSILLAIVVSAVLFALIVSISYLFDPSSVAIMVPLGIMFTGIYTWSSYQYGDKVVLMSTNAQPAEGNKYIYLNDTVEGLAIAAGIPKPDVYVMPSMELNAYATGKDPENASIAVTQGLLDTLDRQELEGVIAHEISHIRNKDVQFMTLVAVLVGIAGILSHMILRSWRFGGKRRSDKNNGSIDVLILGIGFLLAIFAPILSRLVQMAVSRSREYLADASAAEMTRYPDGLADALEKLGKHNRGDMKVSESVSHMFISDPNKTALDALYSTHPPIEERVKRLREM